MTVVSDDVWPLTMPDPRDHSRSAMRERMALLAEWLLTPSGLRSQLGMPDTQAALAEVLGVTPVSVTNWKKHPDFERIMTNAVRRNVGVVAMADIIQNLVGIAMGSSPQAVPAAKLLIQWYQDTPSSGNEDLATLSDEKLVAARQGASKAAPSRVGG